MTTQKGIKLMFTRHYTHYKVVKGKGLSSHFIAWIYIIYIYTHTYICAHAHTKPIVGLSSDLSFRSKWTNGHFESPQQQHVASSVNLNLHAHFRSTDPSPYFPLKKMRSSLYFSTLISIYWGLQESSSVLTWRKKMSCRSCGTSGL